MVGDPVIVNLGDSFSAGFVTKIHEVNIVVAVPSNDVIQYLVTTGSHVLHAEDGWQEFPIGPVA